ncbi:MAG: type II toxin-antitoxin system VapC family toxin [Candidatus Accumulibacter sp.]|jgi:PIN domain nuclease of toxin-antitoxin system|nr:type II toxin-antitoxin system VapC family toxin [Accumulibacter sp.]
MRYLLDTHVALWIFQEKERLSASALAALDDLSSDLCVSLASVWEIAIKISIGKLDFAGGVSGFLETIKDNDIGLVNISSEHLRIVETLPLLHRDPFDRLLIATALADGMTLVTADENILKYDVSHIRAD